MSWEETLERFREALRVEARKRWGRIGKIEARAGMRRGEISDFYSGRRSHEIGALLRALDALEVDHGAFFSRALGWHQRPEEYLAELGVGAEADDAKIARLERATYRLEAETPPPVDDLADASDIEEQVAAVICCHRREQARRLRETRAYCTRAFARAYLKHLDSWRYDAPDEAAELAAMTIFGLIPRLSGPQNERLDLHGWALGIYGSARRVRGRFAAAAGVLRLGLELARRHQRRRQTAELLHRASYLLRDLSQFERALAYLSEALTCYVELGSSLGIGKVLVGRGMLLNAMGQHASAITSLERALEYLQEDTAAAYRCSAYQYLSLAAEQLNDLASAERHLRAAESIQGLRRGLSEGKLMWMRGSLAFRRGHYSQAEESLRSARQVLANYESPGQEALVSLDLMDALLAQRKLYEVIELAREMLHLLEAFKTDRLSSQALIKLIRPAMMGRLSRSAVAETRAAIKAVARRGDREVGTRP